MQRYSDVVADSRGNVMAGASVLVELSGVTATIYSDDGVTLQSNPMTTDATGAFTFYAANGTYTLRTTLVSGGTTVTSRDTVVLYDPAATLSASTGAGLSGFSHAETYAAGTLGAKGKDTVSVKDAPYNAKGDGTADDTAAIQAAIDSFTSGEGTVFFPRGTYKVTSTISVAQNGISLYGAGTKSTTIAFTPTAADTCLLFSKGASVLYNCGLRDISLAGSTAFKKIAVQASDISSFTMNNVEIRSWTGAGSVGLQTLGREVSTFSNLTISADIPIQLSNNPNYTIDCNEFTFRDLYLIGNDVTQPCVLADDGVYFSGLTFEGFQSWVGGKYGFYYSNTTSVAASEKVAFRNVWREQAADATGYIFYIANSGGGNISGLKFDNCHGDTACKGYYLRGILYAEWNGCLYTSTTHEALNVDSSVINMSFHGFHANGGSTATLTGQTLRGSFLKSDSASPFPDVAWYQSSGASARAQMGPMEITTTGLGLKINCAAAANAAEITDGTTDFAVVLNTGASVYTVSNHAVRLGTNNTARWEVQTGGHFVPYTDNTYTLGDASYRIKSAYFSTGVGFHGSTPPATKPSVTGSRGANAALASLLTALAACGIVSDDTTA